MLGWRHCGHRFGCALKRIIFQKTFHDDGCSSQIEKQKWQSDDLHESSLCHKNYKVRQTPTRKADFERKSFSLACRRHSAPTRFYLSYVFTILTMQQLSIVFFRFFNFFLFVLIVLTWWKIATAFHSNGKGLSRKITGYPVFWTSPKYGITRYTPSSALVTSAGIFLYIR